MNIAVIGSEFLSPTQSRTVADILDGIFCRYATGSPVLITRGRDGVESIATRLAHDWNWARQLVVKPDKGRIWRLTHWRDSERQLVESCDILYSVYDRSIDYNRIADRAAREGKKVVEFYV
jgi:hypothetical protein